jgi:hypothetical protein
VLPTCTGSGISYTVDTWGRHAHETSSGRAQWEVGPTGCAVVEIHRPNPDRPVDSTDGYAVLRVTVPPHCLDGELSVLGEYAARHVQSLGAILGALGVRVGCQEIDREAEGYAWLYVPAPEGGAS